MAKIVKRTKKQRRIATVLKRLIALSDNEKDRLFHNELIDSIDGMLRDLSRNDFFGTEGQTDPRGDMRDENWSMWKVEGVDE